MKLRVEMNGRVLEYERPPMRTSRFRAVCGLFWGALYVALVWVVAALCGLPGVIVAAVCTVLLGIGIKEAI